MEFTYVPVAQACPVSGAPEGPLALRANRLWVDSLVPLEQTLPSFSFPGHGVFLQPQHNNLHIEYLPSNSFLKSDINCSGEMTQQKRVLCLGRGPMFGPQNP